METYTVKYYPAGIQTDSPWDGAQWNSANEVKIAFPFAKNNKEFAPSVHFRMLYDDQRICGLFKVEDQYVVSRAKANQDKVYEDSCVEFFVIPFPDDHYYNFEMNCSGKILLHRRAVWNIEIFTVIPEADLAGIERYHTLPDRIEDEITTPTTWYLGFGIPISFFEKYSHVNPCLKGQHWRGNFTKCADKSSHPCWLSWTALSNTGFHRPAEFQELCFE